MAAIDAIPVDALEKGDLVRIQRSWRLDVDVTVAVVTAIYDDGPIIDGPNFEKPAPARAGLVLEVLQADTLLGSDVDGGIHVLDQSRAVIEVYEGGDLTEEFDVPKPQVPAYLEDVERHRGWETLLPKFKSRLRGDWS